VTDLNIEGIGRNTPASTLAAHFDWIRKRRTGRRSGRRREDQRNKVPIKRDRARLSS